MPEKTGAGEALYKKLRMLLGACLAVLTLYAAPAFAQDQENAAEYRIAALSLDSEPGPATLILPPVLSEADQQRYREIFALQEKGNLKAAAKIIATLGQKILMGHVLAQKYLHPTAHRSKYSELKPWLAEYADHPDARRLYLLAIKRRPGGAERPRQPIPSSGITLHNGEKAYAPPRIKGRGITRAQRDKLAKMRRDMRWRIRRGWPTGAREILTSKAHLGLASTAQFDEYQARIAWSYYLHNKDGLAYELAADSAERSRKVLPDADWTAGLAAWRLGRLEAAVGHFAKLADSETASPWMVASGAYWAARAELRLRRPQYVSYWLKIAAGEPRTFYGLLAIRALGLEPDLNWRSSVLTRANIAELDKSRAARRARALAEVGESERAAREVTTLWPRANSALTAALLPLAQHLGLARAQLAMGAQLRKINGEPYDAADYPVPNWQPEGGYRVDRALIFGLIRQESKFRASAKSRLGARGVMQVMPRTARFAAKREGIKDVDHHTLLNPELNIALGQSYVRHLLEHEEVDGNIFYLLCAYNAGPGNLKKWKQKANFADDPLLFIESIRSRETRNFIERVATNYWIYRMRLGQATPSLDATASGLWPSYAAQERGFASHE